MSASAASQAVNGALGEMFLRSLIRGAGTVAPTMIAGPIGAMVGSILSEIGEPMAMAGYKWLTEFFTDSEKDNKGNADAARQQAFDELANISRERAEKIVHEALAEVPLDPQARTLLVNHLASIPMTARNALARTASTTG